MSRVQLPPNALLLAPMVGISHRALRELVEGFGGCDLYYTEMSSAAGFVSGSPYDRYFLDTLPAPERTILQFYATDIPRMVQAARAARSIPAFGLDINFGCSAPHIEKSGGGVSWMRDPAAAREMASAVRDAWPDRSLSVKLRIGYDDDYGRLRDFCAGLETAGADFLVLHPRLKNEKFRRSGRWEYVRRLGTELGIPVIGNGDVRGFDVWRNRADSFSPGGIMVGREAARRPWFFTLVRRRQSDPDFSLTVDLAETAEKALCLIERHLPPEFHISRARRFFYYFCDNFSYAHHVKWKIQNAPDLETIRAALSGYFEQVPGDAVRADR